MYSADVTDADITAYWRKINPPQYHLPAGGGNSSSSALGKYMHTLEKCKDKLKNRECRRLIKEKWEEFRRNFCQDGYEKGGCRAKPEQVKLLKKNRQPVSLFEFLASTSPLIGNKQFKRELLKWAEKENGSEKCRRDPRNGLTVCGGLKKDDHYAYKATTLGDVMLTGKPLHKQSPTLLKHEAVHAKQWDRYSKGANFWPTFLVYYFAAGPWCSNRYEIEAETKGGVTSECHLMH
ncbi:hypothetical protein HS045_33730 [Planomonospora sp. ID82291]|nr:hypothetical protein [Planomonospora sp. ID82291]